MRELARPLPITTLAARVLGIGIAAQLFASAPVDAQDASEAGGSDRPRVSLAIDEGCAALDEGLVRRVLDVELGSEADLESPIDEATSLVSVRCDDALVELSVDEPLTNKHLERSIDLGASEGAARSRLVAIAIAELLAASWIELGMEHDEALAPAEEPGTDAARAAALEVARERLGPEPEEPESPPPAPRPLGVRAYGVARVSGDPFHFSGGGGLALDTALLLPLALVVDVRAETGSADVAGLGSVRFSDVTAAAMLALRAGFGLAHADFALGLRGGLGVLDATTLDGAAGGSQLGAVLGVLTATHLSLAITGTVFAHVGIELGWIFVPVYGTDASTGEIVARIGGAQLAITAGIEVRPE